MANEPAKRITSITLDDASIIRRTLEVEHERQVAITDLVGVGEIALAPALAGKTTGPFALFLSVRDGRLTLRLTGEDKKNAQIALSLTPFRSIIKDYFLMCEGYYDAIKHAPHDRIQTLDMARRAVHNEGSELLNEALKASLIMDFATARRLFTLLCVLHIK